MYRLSEEVAHKILRNIRSPELGIMDLTPPDPFIAQNLNSIGYIDPYCCIGSEFNYSIELPYPFVNPMLPPLPGLNGYWLYKRHELLSPTESFSVPRYLADPNVRTDADLLDVKDCSIVVASDIDKLTCKSITTFDQLIKLEPLIVDCLNKELV